MPYLKRQRFIGPLMACWLVMALASVVLAILAHNQVAAPGAHATYPLRTFTLAAGLISIIIGCSVIFLVRAELRQGQIESEALLQKLQSEQLLKEKGAFLANMSHEIRSPMNSILGFSELLEPEGLTPKQAEYVRAIRDSGASLLQTINDILDLSKLDAGRVELRPDPTDMRDSCEFLRTVFAQQAVNKSLHLEFRVDEDVPRALLIDRLRLRQILVNLLSNSVKFTERGSVQTHVSWETNPGSNVGVLAIDVIDTGIGIPADQLGDIFKPFVQIRTGCATNNQGTGIGLTIVKRLITMMNGTLTVHSRLGEGSTFHLRLPEVPISVRLPVGDHAEPSGSIDFNLFAPATLLVVDDNHTNRDLLLSMFGNSHHRIATATNGREAMNWLAKNSADLVLLDLRMPVLDGRATLAEMRHDPRLVSIPVIAVTASSPIGDEATLRNHFSGFIRKPFSRQSLFHELGHFLQRMPAPPAITLDELKHLDSVPLTRHPERLIQWHSLVLDLRKLQSDEWPTLSATLAINDTLGFAEALRKLGSKAQCEILNDYSTKLISLAASYAVLDLETLLLQFPSVVDSIAKVANQPLKS